MSAEVFHLPSRDPYRELVAEEVRAVAARKRVSSARLAEAVNISHASMSRRMTGKYPFDIDELAAIASVLDVPITDLLPPEEKGGPRRSPDEGQDGAAKTIWSRLATVHPIRPGMTDVTFERLPRKAAG